MNTIKNTAEDLIAAIITTIRNIVSPIFGKYTMYYKYIDIFFYSRYLVILLGFYNTVPEYIPIMRNIILYIVISMI